MDKKELKKWKNIHNTLIDIRIGIIKNTDKIRDKKERIKEVKEQDKKEWIEFKDENYS